MQDVRSQSWRVQAVGVAPDRFESRKALPWRGMRDDELSAETGIPGCVFVHMSGFIGGNKTYEGALEMARAALKCWFFEAKHLSVIVFPHVSAGLVNSSFSNTLCNFGLPMLSLTCSRSWHESSFYGRDGFFWAIWWWFECGNFIKMNGVTHSFVALVWYSHQCIVCALTDGIVIQTEIWRSSRFTFYTRIKMSGECLKGNINIIFLLT